MYRRLRPSLAVAGLLAAGVACGSDEGTGVSDTTIEATPTVPDETAPEDSVPDPTTPDPTTPDPTTPDPTTPDPTVPDDPLPEEPNTDGWPVAASLIDAAVADLVETVGADGASIVVLLAESVTWRDGSLGCPMPDRAYTQALVDGYRIELAVDDATYWYHGSADSEPFRCDDPREPAPGGTGDR